MRWQVRYSNNNPEKVDVDGRINATYNGMAHVLVEST